MKFVLFSLLVVGGIYASIGLILYGLHGLELLIKG